VITRSLGSAGPTVGVVGLGCMGMSDFYGPADEAESIATIHAALDAGITLLDTGDYYGMGHNELLLREALRGRDRLAEALGALPLELTADDLAAIERAVPAGAAAGDRNHAPQMATLDSERAGAAAR
jgi:aryl-alcohol dehydrogenase-like predicted oxidoreductase